MPERSSAKREVEGDKAGEKPEFPKLSVLSAKVLKRERHRRR